VSATAPEGARRDRFTAIYESNYHRILGYALRRASDDEAADVVAETFLVAWRRLNEVPEGDEARLWLYGTARRVLANRRRAQRRRERLAARVRTELEPTIEPDPLAPGASSAAAAWRRLRPEDRELLALVAWEGLDSREIAQVYACSSNAVRIRLHRARRRFARELARHNTDVSPERRRVVGLVNGEELL
jgi:RNA polymerase sigma-70 factor, ECF subfamily